MGMLSKPHQTKIRKALCLLLIFSSCVTAFAGCKKKEEQVIPVLADPVAVKLDTEKVVKDTIYDIEFYDGSVVPYTQGIYFDQEIKVEKVLAGVGDTVKKGQTLLSIDRTSWQEEYDTLVEEIEFTKQNNAYLNEQADCDLRIAQLQLAQMQATATENELALKKLDIEALQESQTYTRQTQELELDTKLKRLIELEEKINQSDLIAPFDGTIVYCSNLYEGITVKAYDTIMYLADDSKLSVRTTYISKDTLEASKEYYALMDDKKYSLTNIPYEEEEYKYRVYNKLSLKSHFALDGAKDDELVCGNYVAICLIKNYAENVLVIPKKALYRDGSIRYVYKVVNGERARQEVKIGKSTQIMVEITEGLSEGDEVYVQQ